MNNKVLAVVSSLQFQSKPLEHTVSYDKNARQATRDGASDWKAWEGTFKAFVGDYDAAVENLRAQIDIYLRNGWWQLNPKDFTFTVSYSDIQENNCWLLPCTSRCGVKGYPVSKRG